MITEFSYRQLQALTWWKREKNSFQGIICDGAVRSGKTFCLALSFVLWCFSSFEDKNFAFCGKTIGSLHRNVVTSLLSQLEGLGFQCCLVRSKNLLTIHYNGVENRFYFFGGKDEGSSSLIQGITLAGVLFDEVALMPRSFVEQALARCSVEGAKFWFNCNPEHPGHWFYKEWICKAEQKNILYLHFIMSDNPSLSEAVLERYENLYSGVFYQRYILGKWTQAQGAIYPMFSFDHHVIKNIPQCTRYVVSCDYGTTNPTSFGLWGYNPEHNVWIRIKEYYHCSRTTGVVKTDAEYTHDMEKFTIGYSVETIVIDPSAASFIQALRETRKYAITPANNKVVDGIRLVASQLTKRSILFHESCSNIIEEFLSYRWKDGSGKEEPLQESDHAMDEMRYFVSHIFSYKVAVFMPCLLQEI